jgi:hypothetical protein
VPADDFSDAYEHVGAWAWEMTVRAENWHEERDRLVKLVNAIESGVVTHVDQGGISQLQKASPANIAQLKKRLATLNARVGDSTG